ncbi:hypothetical protein KIN20_035750 [Parelaphostrongylus tenuis]|uniref:Uncharacterized protein n=1 Tax=Parelaphostrongylus tenuis TaxID=148309 RepID=A0AAD5WL50_PARTN|nr:hypothetical protein KIN20_035750 [Parelaphostrongylus tenuis]
MASFLSLVSCAPKPPAASQPAVDRPRQKPVTAYYGQLLQQLCYTTDHTLQVTSLHIPMSFSPFRNPFNQLHQNFLDPL